MKWTITVFALLSSVGAALGADRVVRATPPQPLHESVTEQVDVSGSVVVGVGRRDALAGAEVMSGVRVRAGVERYCMMVRSRDGIYFARNTFIAPEGAAAEQVELAMESSRNRSLLQGLDETAIAVSVRSGACDGEQGAWFVATSRDRSSDVVDILINGADATAAFWQTAGQEGECEVFEEGRSTAYNMRCSLSARLLSEEESPVRIERERFGRPLPAVTLQLRKP